MFQSCIFTKIPILQNGLPIPFTSSSLSASVSSAQQCAHSPGGLAGPCSAWLDRAWTSEDLLRRDKSESPANRSLSCRCQGLISSSSSAVQASTPQNRTQLFKEIKGNCYAVQEHKAHDVNQQHLRSSK